MGNCYSLLYLSNLFYGACPTVARFQNLWKKLSNVMCGSVRLVLWFETNYMGDQHRLREPREAMDIITSTRDDGIYKFTKCN